MVGQNIFHGKRSCFNRAIRHTSRSQEASKTAPGYLAQSRNTTENPLPKVVQDFQIRFSSTAQSGFVATKGGHWPNSRKRPVFDQSGAEWGSRKARKKESGTMNAQGASQPVAGNHRWDNIQRINEGFSALSAGNNDQALKIADALLKELLKTHANLSLRNYRS